MTCANVTTCRCEAVLESAIREAIEEGNLTVNDIKRRTRAGMGICQGAFCNAAVARLLIEAGVEPASVMPMTARPPMRLISLHTARSSIAGEGT